MPGTVTGGNPLVIGENVGVESVVISGDDPGPEVEGGAAVVVVLVVVVEDRTGQVIIEAFMYNSCTCGSPKKQIYSSRRSKVKIKLHLF